jgi:hypothetical protein
VGSAVCPAVIPAGVPNQPISSVFSGTSVGTGERLTWMEWVVRVPLCCYEND